MTKDQKTQIQELDEKILAITRKRFDLQFEGPGFSEARLKKWMEFAAEVEKLVEEKNKIMAQELDNAKVHA